jgi:hypothetical protein
MLYPSAARKLSIHQGASACLSRPSGYEVTLEEHPNGTGRASGTLARLPRKTAFTRDTSRLRPSAYSVSLGHFLSSMRERREKDTHNLPNPVDWIKETDFPPGVGILRRQRIMEIMVGGFSLLIGFDAQPRGHDGPHR